MDPMSALQDLCQLTRQHLSAPFKDRSLAPAGSAALILLPRDPRTCMRLAYQQLHAVPYAQVKTCWRRLYVDASLWVVIGVVQGEEEEKWADKIVETLDTALILTGAVGREELVGRWFEVLEGWLGEEEASRPVKRRKLGASEAFPDQIGGMPALQCPVERSKALSLSAFQAKVSKPDAQTPLVIEGAIDHWPAFDSDRAWKKPAYLMRKTLNGRRLVPVEIGRSYTDAGWGQKILSFRDFMERYMLDANLPDRTRGYLAQHDLFAQIPSLRADIGIPEYCYTIPAPQPSNPSNVKPVEDLDGPLLNAWFGPAGTISPLHTDPYHNILAQVVGYKYVRLYAPEETPKMYPRGIEGDGVDMSNTSCVDLDEAAGAWEGASCWGDANGRRCNGSDEVREVYPLFREARYVEGVLGPGECLYVPTGWWHYVRSLTPSFSVSFWWN